MKKFCHREIVPTKDNLDLIQQCSELITPNEGNLSHWYKNYARTQHYRLAQDLTIIQNTIRSGDKILEFGSTPPILTAALHNVGYTIKGIDLAPNRFSNSIYSIGLDIVKCDIELEDPPIPDNSYDIIVFNEIFEHLRINPIFTLTNVKKILRPGGKLILSTPNLRSLRGVINFLVRNKSYSCSPDIYEQYLKLETIGHMGHVREYTTSEIVEFLNRIGFIVQGCYYRGTYKNVLARATVACVPEFKPFVSYIARKPVDA